jgi:hypothetical protein
MVHDVMETIDVEQPYVVHSLPPLPKNKKKRETKKDDKEEEPPTKKVKISVDKEEEIKKTVLANYRKELVHKFHCVICFVAPVDAHHTSCGHIYCGACIKAAMEKETQCPICRMKLEYPFVKPLYGLQELSHELNHTGGKPTPFVPDDGRKTRRFMTKYTPEESRLVDFIKEHVDAWRQLKQTIEVPFGENWEQMPSVVTKWNRDHPSLDCSVKIERGTNQEPLLVISSATPSSSS